MELYNEELLDFINDNYMFIGKYKHNIVIKKDSFIYKSCGNGKYYERYANGDWGNYINIYNNILSVVYPFINMNGSGDNIPNVYLMYIYNLLRSLTKNHLVIVNETYVENYILRNPKIKQNSYNLINIYDNIINLSKRDLCINEIYKYNKNINEYYDVEYLEDVLNDNIKLYNYQINDVKWMYKIRNDVRFNKNIIKYKEQIEYTFGNYIYDNNTKTLYENKESNTNDKLDMEYIYYGGNLISEMGLGKSIITMYYILTENYNSRRKYNEFIEIVDSDKCSYLYKKGKNNGTFCKRKRKNGIYCREHRGNLFLDKPITIYKNLDRFRLVDFIENGKIKSNASLIICPNHLCDQWVNEYYSKFKNDKRVCMIITQNQYNNITLGDLLLSDILIISYQFLVKIRSSKNKNIEIRELGLDTKEYNYIDLYKWRGIFLDEVHEIFNNHIVLGIIGMLRSETIWNITGTPYSNGFFGFSQLLNILSHQKKDFINLELIQNVKWLFRKNNKRDIIEIKKNIIQNNLKLIKFTQQEKNIYESYNNENKHIDFLIRLCCDIELNKDIYKLVKNSKTLNEIQNIMLQETNSKCVKLDEEMKLLNIEKDNIIHLLDGIDIDSELNTELKHLLAKVRRNLTLKTTEYNNIHRIFTYLNNVINTLNDTEQECPICLDEIDKVTITKCGHKFCWDCLYETYNVHNMIDIKCPACNTKLTKYEIYLLDEPQVEQPINELDILIEECKSSKLGNIIYFIKNLEATDKVIIFSQWDVILHKIERLLNKYKLEYVHCTGTVYNKKKMIKLFTIGDMNIILLSSKNSASGINLTIANKIILVEPVYGTKEYKDNIEAQAIGRVDRIGQTKPIDIYRFIIEDTIEEEIHNGFDDYNVNINT